MEVWTFRSESKCKILHIPNASYFLLLRFIFFQAPWYHNADGMRYHNSNHHQIKRINFQMAHHNCTSDGRIIFVCILGLVVLYYSLP